MDSFVGMAQAKSKLADSRQPLPPELCARQEQLVAQALRLRKRLGDPVDGLAELMSTLPPEEDAFWLQLEETF